jgi:hypothetical protein
MMKNLRAFFSAVILIVIAVPIGMAQEKTGELPFRPNYDREIFKKSGTSIARPDLLACRNEDAVITDGGDVDIDDFARTLHGVWVNQNGRSLHGVTIETDNAFYVDMRGRTGVAIMIDRNNLGDFSLTKPYLTPGNRLRKTSRPLTMTFVNCTFQFLDRYVKVSDEIPYEVLASSTGIRMSKNMTLELAWQRIVSSGYFESFNMATKSREAGAPRRKVSMASLGDGQRMAVLPDGTRVDEKGIVDGLVPGAEYSLPMMVGGFFKITLTPKTEGRAYQSVHMRFDAEYRATGVALKPGETLTGVEQGVFAREGNAYVSAKRLGSASTKNAAVDPNFEEISGDEWATDDCGDKNALIANTAATTRNGPAEAVHNSLHFERVVIGTPGGTDGVTSRASASPSRKQHRQHKR